MYALHDVYNSPIFKFKHDGAILDREDKKIGSVINGVVCNEAGIPTRVTVEGTNIVWHGANPGVVLSVIGVIVMETGGVGPVGIVINATNQQQIMIAAAAYWEFVDSQT